MEDNEGHGESACEDLGWWKLAGHCRDWEMLSWEGGSCHIGLRKGLWGERLCF